MEMTPYLFFSMFKSVFKEFDNIQGFIPLEELFEQDKKLINFLKEVSETSEENFNNVKKFVSCELQEAKNERAKYKYYARSHLYSLPFSKKFWAEESKKIRLCKSFLCLKNTEDLIWNIENKIAVNRAEIKKQLNPKI